MGILPGCELPNSSERLGFRENVSFDLWFDIGVLILGGLMVLPVYNSLHLPCTIRTESYAHKYNHVQGFLFRLNSRLPT